MVCKQERLEIYFFSLLAPYLFNTMWWNRLGGVMEKKLQDVKGAARAAVPVTEAIWSRAEGHRHLPTAVCTKMIRNLAIGGWGVE